MANTVRNVNPYRPEDFVAERPSGTRWADRFLSKTCGTIRGNNLVHKDVTWYAFPRSPGSYCRECALVVCHAMWMGDLYRAGKLQEFFGKGEHRPEPAQTTHSLPNTYGGEQQEMYGKQLYPHEIIVYRATYRPNTEDRVVYIGKSTIGLWRWSAWMADAFLPDRNPDVFGKTMCRLLREDQTAFSWEVVEVCRNETELADRELFHIAQHVNAGDRMFNEIGTARFGFGPHGVDNPYILEMPKGARFGYTTSQGSSGDYTLHTEPTPKQKHAAKVAASLQDVIHVSADLAEMTEGHPGPQNRAQASPDLEQVNPPPAPEASSCDDLEGRKLPVEPVAPPPPPRPRRKPRQLAYDGPLTEELADRANVMREEGMSYVAIAGLLGLSASALKHGLRRRGLWKRIVNKVVIDTKKMVELREQGLTLYQIGRICNVSHVTVWHKLKEHKAKMDQTCSSSPDGLQIQQEATS